MVAGAGLERWIDGGQGSPEVIEEGRRRCAGDKAQLGLYIGQKGEDE